MTRHRQEMALISSFFIINMRGHKIGAEAVRIVSLGVALPLGQQSLKIP